MNNKSNWKTENIWKLKLYNLILHIDLNQLHFLNDQAFGFQLADDTMVQDKSYRLALEQEHIL